MKLALGTVQFGLDYGISNNEGRVSAGEIERILSTAKQHNITLLDSAAAYGDSEIAIGKSPLNSHFNIVTKISALKDNEPFLLEQITKSLANLQCGNVETLLLHDVRDLISSKHKKKNIPTTYATKDK